MDLSCYIEGGPSTTNECRNCYDYGAPVVNGRLKYDGYYEYSMNISGCRGKHKMQISVANVGIGSKDEDPSATTTKCYVTLESLILKNNL